MNASKIAIVVDPYSSGAHYASEFAKHGVSCIAIQSILPLPAHFVQDFIPEDFIEVLSSSHESISHLSTLNIVAVVAGCDTGVILTDDLSQRLDLSGNDASTSFRDFSMHLNEFDDEGSFVIKPINSAGSEDVRFAQGRQGLAQAMKASAWEEENVLGEVNSGFAVQPFIRGCEYVVDMVAIGGIFVSSVCRVHKVEKNNSKFVCDSVDLLDPRDAELTDLIEYARRAARALGVVLGPIHMELIWGPNGPVMIEAGARLPGAGLPFIYSKVYNPDLLSTAVNTYLGMPITYPGMATRAYSSEREQFGRIVCLISEAECEFGGLTDCDLKKLRGLESYCGHKLYIREHDRLGRTIDFATCPGVIFLTHDRLSHLDKDEESVRDIFSGYLSTN